MEENNSKGIECPLCLQNVYLPVSTSCGHIFCWRCLKPWLDTQKKMTCPICKNGISYETITKLHLDGYVKPGLPYFIPPPIIDIRAIFSFSSGYPNNSSPTLVRGPVATMVTFSLLFLNVLAINSAALIFSSSLFGSGKAGPSSPDSPCMLAGALKEGRYNGQLRPLATGTSRPIKAITLWAL